MADLSDPKFWGIVVVLWLFCTIVIWKGLFGAWASVKMKVAITIIMFPITLGISYLMSNK